jgi:hypothetical protein
MFGRFGRICLTDEEMGMAGKTFNEDFSDEQLKLLIEMVALRTGSTSSNLSNISFCRSAFFESMLKAIGNLFCKMF